MKSVGCLFAVVAFLILAAIVIGTTAYTVPETHYALVIEFGKVVDAVAEPGLHFKKPFIQSVAYFEKWIGALPDRRDPADRQARRIDSVGAAGHELGFPEDRRLA